MYDVRRLDAVQDHVHDRDDVRERFLLFPVKRALLQGPILRSRAFRVLPFQVIERLAEKPRRAASSVVYLRLQQREDHAHKHARHPSAARRRKVPGGKLSRSNDLPNLTSSNPLTPASQSWFLRQTIRSRQNRRHPAAIAGRARAPRTIARRTPDRFYDDVGTKSNVRAARDGKSVHLADRRTIRSPQAHEQFGIPHHEGVMRAFDPQLPIGGLLLRCEAHCQSAMC
jgi:hypothetical protein